MAYNHQTWQGGDLLWEDTTHKTTQPFEHVATWGQEINYTTIPMATTPGRVVAHNEELLSINSQDTLITWRWKIKW